MSSRASAISAAGVVLSQPTMQTSASKSCASAISSIESAITSRETSDARIPGVPCDWLSETAIVLNGSATPPAALDRRRGRVGELALGEVARHRARPGRGDADDRPVEARRDRRRSSGSGRARRRARRRPAAPRGRRGGAPRDRAGPAGIAREPTASAVDAAPRARPGVLAVRREVGDEAVERADPRHPRRDVRRDLQPGVGRHVRVAEHGDVGDRRPVDDARRASRAASSTARAPPAADLEPARQLRPAGEPRGSAGRRCRP